MRMALLSNYSTQYLAKSLRECAANFDSNLEVWESDFGNWQLALNGLESEELERFRPSTILITLAASMLDLSAEGLERLTNGLLDGIRAFRQNNDIKIFVSGLEIPEYALIDDTAREAISAGNQFLTTSQTIEGYNFINLDPLLLKYGAQTYAPGKYRSLAGFGHHPRFYPLLARYLFGHIAATFRRRTRLVICDLDNTLWRGILGDDGHQGIDAGFSTPGAPHRDLQMLLKSLHHKGVLLAISSKNELENVQVAFANREDFVLSLDDFAAVEANWEPKSESIRKILNDLNLTEPGTVFLDDSAFERREVHENISNIEVPDLPKDAEDWSGFLFETQLFQIPISTKEDFARNEFYKSERKRRNIRETKTNEQFLEDLNLECTLSDISPANTERAVVLINKTNQFNINGKRVEGLLPIETSRESGMKNYRCILSLTDKLSRYGEVGYVEYKLEQSKLVIVTWVLSCRAFSRTLEHFVVCHLATVAERNSIDVIEIEMKRTDRNKPTFTALEKMGFCMPAVTNERETISATLAVADALKLRTFVALGA